MNNSAYFEVLNPSMQTIFPGAREAMSTSITRRVWKNTSIWRFFMKFLFKSLINYNLHFYLLFGIGFVLAVKKLHIWQSSSRGCNIPPWWILVLKCLISYTAMMFYLILHESTTDSLLGWPYTRKWCYCQHNLCWKH